MSRPEHEAPPEIFYDEIEARKYTSNSRMIEIQTQLTERAVELLNLPTDKSLFILDIGSGSGLSGETLTDLGHVWVGTDISHCMLDVAKEREVEGDMILHDMGTGFSFRPGTFDGAISISALQWLCNAYTSQQIPKKKRLIRFFTSLYGILSRGARAVFQFYPETASQMDLISNCVMQAGFSGGFVVDYPNSSKAKKHFLCLFAGVTDYQMPSPLGVEIVDEQPKEASFATREKSRQKKKKGKREPVKSKNWVLQKKERQRQQGKDVRTDTKYSGRSRRRF